MYNVNYLNLCDFGTPGFVNLSLLRVIGIRLTLTLIVAGELINL